MCFLLFSGMFLVAVVYGATYWYRAEVERSFDVDLRSCEEFELVFLGRRYWPEPYLKVRISDARAVENFRELLKSNTRSHLEIEGEYAMAFELWVFGLASDGTCQFHLVIKPPDFVGKHDKLTAIRIFEFAREFGKRHAANDRELESLKRDAAKQIRRDFN